MENTSYRAIAIVGVGAILPDAPNAPAFWENVKNGRYSISARSSPIVGTPLFITIPIRTRPIKHIRKSAAG